MSPREAVRREAPRYVVDRTPDPWSAGPWRLYLGPRTNGPVTCSRHFTQAEACDEAARRVTHREAGLAGMGVKRDVLAASRRVRSIWLIDAKGEWLQYGFHSWHDAATWLVAARRRQERRERALSEVFRMLEDDEVK